MQKAGGGEGVVMGCLGKTGSGVSLRLWTRSPDPSEDCECITLNPRAGELSRPVWSCQDAKVLPSVV